MSSTWEVWCIWTNIYQAFLKAMVSVWIDIPKKNVLLSIWWVENKVIFVKYAKKLAKMWYKLFATKGTAKILEKNSIKLKIVNKFHKDKKDNVITYLENWKIDFVINIPSEDNVRQEEDSWYFIRRKAVDSSISMINNLKVAMLYIKSMEVLNWKEKVEIDSYSSIFN
jgi:hypothetical protein